MVEDEADEQPATTKEANGQDVNPERQVDILYRRLKGAAEVVGELQWERDLLYSTEVDEILQFCRQVVKAISQQRNKVPQPKEKIPSRIWLTFVHYESIGIIDAELLANGEHRFPNLAAMKLSAFHKERGDAVSLVTRLPIRANFDRVYVCCVFTDTAKTIPPKRAEAS